MFASLLSKKFKNVIYYVEPLRSDRKVPLIKRIDGNLFVVDIPLFPYIPQLLKYTSYLKLAEKLSHLLLWALLKIIRVKNPIFIIYQPHNLALAKKLSSTFGKSLLCYDSTDDWSKFPGLSEWRVKQIQKSEKSVIKEVDVVLAVSETLYKKAKDINPNTFNLPNATSFENFNKVTQDIQVAPEILACPEPRIGYVGKITPWRLDFDLIKYIAQTRPMWSIIMIGPIHTHAKALVKELSKFKNIVFLGPKKYYSLPNYIKGFNTCVLPHKVDALTESMDPIKLYDYMATGKPIVATGISEALKFKNIIRIANSKEDFLSSLDEICMNINFEENTSERITIAKSNSWTNRTDQLINILRDALNRRTTSKTIIKNKEESGQTKKIL
jgi:glycosyltransferase involved in cell wall biosynthesis